MSKQVEDLCIICEKQVRGRQQALLCDGCNRWQHRVCKSGISQKDYREAVQQNKAINWQYKGCLPANAKDVTSDRDTTILSIGDQELVTSEGDQEEW